MIDDALAALAGSPGALPLLFALVLGDAFLVVLPGEAAVTAYAAISVSQGVPPLVAVIGVAAAAAMTGDFICYTVGRLVGLDRWAWMRRPRVARAFGWARERLERSTASVLFSARFIPFARLAVNLTAGAGRMPFGRYGLFAGGAAVLWAIYQAFIGAAVAQLIPGAPLLAVVISIVVALSVGALLDVVLTRRFGAPRGVKGAPGVGAGWKGGGMGEHTVVDGVHAYRAEPAATPRGGVVLIHEIWGLVPHIEDVADRFAAEGYAVIAPDLLSDAGITPTVGAELHALRADPDETVRTAAQPRLREALAPTRAPDFAVGALSALRRAVDTLATTPGVDGRIAVVGFCFGGSYAFSLAAHDDRIRAAVPFYGRAPEADEIAEIGCPVLAFYGAHDHALVDALPGVRATMAAARVDFTPIVYPDAGHAFFNDTNAVAHRPDDAADAWRRTLDFLAARLA
ncbi:dienelactone hydrolase family protein [Microbacterium sp. CJ88]|uniref:dienelactone hydrolase family protein n=1 Tax=Microbacterium sp. CJ88 TaxID=3445672 RepID=UPI003F656E7B